jgi:membrane fusion protein (multidrug efflux system)
MRRFAYWSLLAALALVLSGSAYHFLYRKAGIPAAQQSAEAAVASADKAATVEAAPVAIDTVLSTIRAVGSLRPNEAVVISPEIAGRIARLPFDEGQVVKAGDTLVELDSTMLRAELDKARSTFTLAEANRERAMTLAEQGSGSLRTRDESVAAYHEAQANRALAEARLAKATIAAPFPGRVGIRSVSVGAYVNPGDRIVELADIDPIKVDFRVPALALPNVRVGQTIRVTVDALPGQTIDGEVYVVDPIVEANGRAIRLRARIPNPDGRLSPGLFARVQIVVDKRDNAVLIPESAVFADGQSQYVYRVVDGRAVQTKIELGQRRPGQVEVRRGLARDAVVITAGHQQIRNGSRVTIVKAEAKA